MGLNLQSIWYDVMKISRCVYARTYARAYISHILCTVFSCLIFGVSKMIS